MSTTADERKGTHRKETATSGFAHIRPSPTLEDSSPSRPFVDLRAFLVQGERKQGAQSSEEPPQNREHTQKKAPTAKVKRCKVLSAAGPRQRLKTGVRHVPFQACIRTFVSVKERGKQRSKEATAGDSDTTLTPKKEGRQVLPASGCRQCLKTGVRHPLL